MKIQENRFFFFDNLRYIMILLVVVFHSSFAYIKIGQLWPVVDSAHTGRLENFIFLRLTAYLDGFIIPVLFFIAGFFVKQSLIRHGPVLFLKRKLIRFGVPLLFISIFFIPIINYISLYSKSLLCGRSYFDIWFHYIISAFDSLIRTDLYNDTEFLAFFTPLHLWFLTLLFVFYLFYSVIYLYERKVGFIKIINNNNSYIVIFIVFILINSIIMFLLFNIFKPGQWLYIGPLFSIQPDRVQLYFTLFLLGEYANRRNWFQMGYTPGRLYIWIILLIFFMLGNISFGAQLYLYPESGNWIKLGYSFFRSGYCLFSVITYSIAAFKILNSKHIIHKKLADNSYNIYLLHFTVVVFFQLLFSSISNIPSTVKLLSVSGFSILTCLIVSEELIKKYSGISVILLIALFLVMTLLL